MSHVHPKSPPTRIADAAVAERSTAKFLEFLNTSGSPPLESIPTENARAALVGLQKSVDVDLLPVETSETSIVVAGRNVPLTIVRPIGEDGVLPAFMFFHGGGWILGDFETHERFVRDLVVGSGAAAVFVDYLRTPEARFPTAALECYAATKWTAENGGRFGIDGRRLVVAGNSAGGNLATSTALRIGLEGGPKLRGQVLFWPVTDAGLATPSYDEFPAGYFLSRGLMQYAWDQYVPDPSLRRDIYASPLRADLEQLRRLPPTHIQTAELDVLRDEGEAYARKLDAAGVEVTALRMNGMIHDYGLLNPLARIPAVRTALQTAAKEIKRFLASSDRRHQ